MQTAMADTPRPAVPVAAIRSLLGYAVFALALLGAPLLLIVESVWARRIAIAAFSAPFGRGEAMPFRDAGMVSSVVTVVERGWFLVALTLVLLVVNRGRPSAWPALMLGLTIPLAIGNVLGPPIGAERVPGLRGCLVGNPVLPSVITVALGYGLARLGSRWLTTPLTEFVARSQRELIVRLRGGGRLRLERDRLVLVPSGAPATPDRPARLAIPWHAVTLLQSGVVERTDRRAGWQLPNGVRLELPDGPALRIIGPDQQWIIPADDAGQLTTAIRIRASRATAPTATAPEVTASTTSARAATGTTATAPTTTAPTTTAPASTGPASTGPASRAAAGSGGPGTATGTAEISPSRWRQVRDLVAAEHRRQRHNPLRAVLADRHDFFLTVGLLWLVLAGLTLPGFVQGWQPVYLLGTAVFGCSAVAVLRHWRSLSVATAAFEASPREPGARPWGETDPVESPMPAWTTVRADLVRTPS